MTVNYYQINQRAVDLLLSVKKHVPAIDATLKALVEIRVSQINRCAYCIDLHSTEARELGVSQQLLDCLPAWKESYLFSQDQMAALEWAEAVTQISSEADMQARLQRLLKHFSETEAVDLTLVIALMNSLNRLAISFGDRPARQNA